MHVLCSCAKQTQKGRTAERYTKHTQKGKKPWSTAEKDFVRMHFKRLPEKSSIEQFLAESKLNRSWKNVKDHIRNQCILQQGDNAFGRCLWK